MAVGRTDREKREMAAFVESLYKRGGWTAASEMAVDSGVHQTTISNLRRGRAMPDGWNLFRLIRATARAVDLDDVTIALEAAAPPAVPASPALEEVVARLEVVVDRLVGPPGALGDGQP